MPRLLLAALLAAALADAASGQASRPAFANTIDVVPGGWKGPVFLLSKDYPAALPGGDPKPWKAFDFKTQPEQYVRAVLAYCREGNEAVDWMGQKNAVRKWFHAPGLVKGNNGREFIHGLTRERGSRVKELAATQTQPWTNFAVGLYNPTAAYTVGRVWKTATPKTDGVKFEDGAVAVKLLFTTAPVDQVPFLANSLGWQANVSLPGSNTRSPGTVRLLQVDVGVRDTRADTTTGWVFGTFMYQHDAPGASPLDRLVPVGLTWGNDPDLTPAKYAAGERAKETWINPASRSPHKGWLDRLNGPVDNPNSSCLSCHGRAGAPQTTDLVFGAAATDAEKLAYFANVKAGDPYKPGVKSLDYSLQLAIGVLNFPGTASAKELEKPAPLGFDFRGGEVDPTQPAEPWRDLRQVATPEVLAPAPEQKDLPDRTNDLLIALAVALVLAAAVVVVVRLKRTPPPASDPPPGT